MAVFSPDTPVHASPPAPVDAPTLALLLARATGAAPAAPAMAPGARLGEWIAWSQAVALSRALDAPPAEPAEGGAPDAGRLVDECAGARAALAADIERGPAAAPASAGFTPFQQHIQSIQRAMHGTTGRLRGELRECLAAGSAEQARLAAVDAAMEAALSPREAGLLASLPAAVAVGFERLQRPASADGEDAPPPSPDDGEPAWLPLFRREVRDLLLAELDLRFQPVEGLLAALRSP